MVREVNVGMLDALGIPEDLVMLKNMPVSNRITNFILQFIIIAKNTKSVVFFIRHLPVLLLNLLFVNEGLLLFSTYLPAGLAGEARPLGVRGRELEPKVPFTLRADEADDVALRPLSGVLLVGIRDGVASSEKLNIKWS